jgi:hypothetical protein
MCWRQIQDPGRRMVTRNVAKHEASFHSSVNSNGVQNFLPNNLQMAKKEV